MFQVESSPISVIIANKAVEALRNKLCFWIDSSMVECSNSRYKSLSFYKGSIASVLSPGGAYAGNIKALKSLLSRKARAFEGFIKRVSSIDLSLSKLLSTQ